MHKDFPTEWEILYGCDAYIYIYRCGRGRGHGHGRIGQSANQNEPRINIVKCSHAQNNK